MWRVLEIRDATDGRCGALSGCKSGAWGAPATEEFTELLPVQSDASRLRIID